MPLQRAIGQAIFKRLAGQGLSAGSMIKLAKVSGGSYRRIDMLSDIRTFNNRRIHENAIRAMPAGATVPQGYMSEEVLKQPRRYRIFGDAIYQDKRTGVMYIKKVSMYSDDLSDNLDYAHSFIEYQPLSETDPTVVAIDFNQTGLSHNKGWSY